MEVVGAQKKEQASDHDQKEEMLNGLHAKLYIRVGGHPLQPDQLEIAP